MINTRLAVRSQIIPIEGDRLLLPNTAVAEIVHYAEPTPVADAPAWLLGLLAWRDRRIPLVSFEAACDQPLPASGGRAKIAVLNTLNENTALDFFAVLTQGVPQLMLVNEGKIAPIEHETATHPLVLSQVILNGEPALIPNLDVLEEMLLALNIVTS